jgi:hypothetical protein
MTASQDVLAPRLLACNALRHSFTEFVYTALARVLGVLDNGQSLQLVLSRDRYDLGGNGHRQANIKLVFTFTIAAWHPCFFHLIHG